MIEEIKKEINKKQGNALGYKIVLLKDVLEILDKYQDKEVTIYKKGSVEHQTFDESLIETQDKAITELSKYKNAWEENKARFKEHYMTWCVNMSGAETKKEINTCEKWKKYWEEKISELEKLEKKYNIGSDK